MTTLTQTTSSRALTVAAAVLAPVALWIAVVPVAGIDLEAQGRRVGVAPVIIGSLLPALAAWALLAVLERRTGRARAIWTAVAVLALALSLGGPLGAATAAAGAALAAMHLLVGAIVILGLRRR
ncbi:DUF6069 family protein [Actinomadura macrotermitis]|uniref:Uncharacterized protein n=1 Tax=Actinomadura macrotermitis TaxID=2585200 RepID=A0A7K0C264_9ACTN|nr:DUF6069 family protein [Actinomadura macrotermitis]MQY07456.1 hypothetical protein [Actinomadura macrotermitis]